MVSYTPMNLPHAENLRSNRRKNHPGPFFVTKCLQPRRNLLADATIACEISEPLTFSVRDNRIHLAAFVIMPDHWHVLFTVHSPWTLPRLMKSVGNWVSRKTSHRLKGSDTIWQDGYYDTRVRSGKQFQYILDYIENNPVKKGLVASRSLWNWGSANPEYKNILTRPWPWMFELDVK